MMGQPQRDTVAEALAQALTVEGSHLIICEGGCLLRYAHRARLTVHNTTRMKTDCVAAGLPVIDCTQVCFVGELRSCLDWPNIAVGVPAGHQNRWEMPTISLQEAAALYARHGAEIINIPKDS